MAGSAIACYTGSLGSSTPQGTHTPRKATASVSHQIVDRVFDHSPCDGESEKTFRFNIGPVIPCCSVWCWKSLRVPQVRVKAAALLTKHPMSACTRPVLRGGASQPAEAGAGAGPGPGAASASAGLQSSAASSSSHYHYQGQQASAPSGRATPPTRPLSRFAEPPGTCPPSAGGRGGAGLHRSLSASRLGNGGLWENGGGGGGGGLPPYGIGDPRIRLSPHPAAPLMQSPGGSQYPEVTLPHQMHGRCAPSPSLSRAQSVKP